MDGSFTRWVKVGFGIGTGLFLAFVVGTIVMLILGFVLLGAATESSSGTQCTTEFVEQDGTLVPIQTCEPIP